MATGEDIWCQLFSEPAAGSDLAGLRTRAERDGDGWKINGQKVWTSWAHEAGWGLLLARTDFDAPKHKGLTMFFVDMKTPGVEVRPIRQMNEKRVFNEVFFTDVRIPDGNRLGEVGNGWRASMTTLLNERTAVIPTGFSQLFDLCRRSGADGRRPIDDPAVRAKLARWSAVTSGLTHTAFRSITSLSRGEEPGPENSIGKLTSAATLQEITRFALELLGPEGLLLDSEPERGGGWFQAMFLRSPALRIEAGSDEILRNVIAERVLRMPGDVRADKDMPFRLIPTGGAG
jgi:acyl-CoA dehydrogenase